MVALSKLFVEHFSWRSCNELLHPHSCHKSALINIWRFTRSNAIYYLPVALLNFLKHALRGINLDLIWDVLCYYAELILGGLVNACLISTSMCALRRVLGEFRLYTLLFVPAALGGAFISLLTPRVKQVQHTAIFQCLIESLLLQRGNPLTKALAASRALQTFVFMCCSALILHGKQRRLHNGFWFLIPNPVKINPNTASKSTACMHDEVECGRHIVRGVCNYFLIGFALDCFKAIMSCIKNEQWNLKQLQLKSTALLSCYVGIYRATNCHLTRVYKGSDSLKHLIAGFLGGLSYLFYPKLTILSYGVLTAGRTILAGYTNVSKRRTDYSDVLFPLALAYLIHTYVFRPLHVSALTGIIIDNTTANYAINISKRLRLLNPVTTGLT